MSAQETGLKVLCGRPLFALAVLASVLPWGWRAFPAALTLPWELVITPVLACVSAFLLRRESPSVRLPGVCAVVLLACFRLLLREDVGGLLLAAAWSISCGMWFQVALGLPKTLRPMTLFLCVQLVACLGVLGMGIFGGNLFQQGVAIALAGPLPLLFGLGLADKQRIIAGWVLLVCSTAAGEVVNRILVVTQVPFSPTQRLTAPYLVVHHGLITLPLLATAMFCLRSASPVDAPESTS